MRQQLAARFTWTTFALGMILSCLNGAICAAEEPAVASVLDDQAWVVVRIRPERVPLTEIYRMLEPVRGLQLPERETIEALSDQLQKAGGRELYIVWGGEAPAFLFVPTTGGADRKAIAAVLTAPVLQQLFTIETSVELPGGIAAGGRSVLTHLQNLKATPREHLAKAMEATADSAIQILLVPTEKNRDSASSVTWSFIPRERTSSIVESLGWGSIGIDVPPKPRLKMVLTSRDEQWIELLKTVLFLTATPYIQSSLESRNIALRDNLQRILTWRQDGNTVTLDVNDDNLDLTILGRGLVQPVVEQVSLRAVNDLTVNNLKQIGIALHNFHDTFKKFPDPAVVDGDNKSLLSWRVTLLPMFEGGSGQLHKEFHLDEPWDSEHNKQLIAKMPSAYQAPLSRAPVGHTHYLGVAGQGMTFEGPNGLAIRRIIDGTSNTIGVVEVDDRHAVPWTKPEDWEFKMDQPAKGLGGPQPGRFTALSLDGAVHAVPKTAAPAVLHALFTYSGREPQRFPE